MKERRTMEQVKDYFDLTKPRILLLILLTGFVAMLMAPRSPSYPLIALTLAGIALAVGAANTLNCYIDRDIDAVMSRTRKRPLPDGRIEPKNALAFGILLAVAAFWLLALFVNLLSALFALGAILFYVVVYTLWLKRSTPQNIVIGGAAGAMAPFIGWAAVTNGVELPPVMLFAIIFLWTPPHFWALALFRSDDYERAGLPMLPVVLGEKETYSHIFFYTLVLVAVSFLLFPLGIAGIYYFAVALAGGAGFLFLAWRLLRRGGAGEARAVFIYSIVYLAVLFLAAGMDSTWI